MAPEIDVGFVALGQGGKDEYAVAVQIYLRSRA